MKVADAQKPPRRDAERHRHCAQRGPGHKVPGYEDAWFTGLV